MKALLRVAAAVFAAAALAPPAFAETSVSGPMRPDDRAGIRGPGAGAEAHSSVRPDDRAGVRGPSIGAPTEAPAVVRVTRPGFDWRDAGIGAAAGIGFALLLVGLALVIRSTRTTFGPA